MALAFEVHGPTKVQLSTNQGTPSWADFGYTDNNDLIGFEMEYMTEPITTTLTGNIPEDYVHLGVFGHLTMTLVKWDVDELASLIQHAPDAAGEGDVGTIGKLKIADGSNNFGLKLIAAASEDTYTFHNCIIEGRGLRRLDFGNKPSRIGLNIICLPDSLGADMSATDNIYTVSRS